MGSFAGAGRRRKASTLIELLIVIAMIGTLVTMLIPSLKRSMDLAAATVCQYNLREVGFSLRMYSQENQGWLPSTAESPIITAGAPQVNQAWFTKLFPTYLQDPVSLACPRDPYGYRMEYAKDLSRPIVAEYASYGVNDFIMNAGDGFLANIERLRPTRPLDTILVADLGPDRLLYDGLAAQGPGRNAARMSWGDGFDPYKGTPPNPWLTIRHNDGVHVLTLGGAIRKARTADIMNQPMQRYYDNCAAGGCTFCNELGLYHYSFARDNLFWWTGPALSK